MGGSPPEFPFTLSDVKKSRVPVQKSAQPQQSYQKQETYQSNTASSTTYTQSSQSAQQSATAASNVAVPSQQVSNNFISELMPFSCPSQLFFRLHLQQVVSHLDGVLTRIHRVDALTTITKDQAKPPGKCPWLPQRPLQLLYRNQSLHSRLLQVRPLLLLPLLVHRN